MIEIEFCNKIIVGVVFMYHFGLKLFSVNENYLKEAIRLYEKGAYNYIELYSVPGSFEDCKKLWKGLPMPFIVHAPHFGDGLNFAMKELRKKNRVMAEEAFRYADLLKAPIVIFHPGVNGDIKETAYQMKRLNDKRVIVENKPYFGLAENLICNGSTPEEIEFLIKEGKVGFCLDMGHAICAANASGFNPLEYIEKFLELKPAMYHLTDGDYYGVFDRHDHYGKGSFPILHLLKLIPPNSKITNEAVKDFADSLRDFEEDMKFISGLLI